MKRGRPTKYKPIMCKRAKDYLAEGYSKRATCGLLGINDDTFYAWIKQYPDFSDCVDQGSRLGEAMYIKKAQRLVDGEKGCFPALAYLLTNLYRYRSEPKDEVEDSKPINIHFSLDKPKDPDDDNG